MKKKKLRSFLKQMHVTANAYNSVFFINQKQLMVCLTINTLDMQVKSMTGSQWHNILKT